MKIFFFFAIFTLFTFSKSLPSLCITSTASNTFCSTEENNTLLLSSVANIEDHVYNIQNFIRLRVNSKEKIILMAEKFDATLLAIAEGNLLPYYRKNIKGLVLKEPLDFISEDNSTEVFSLALSLPSQMDEYGKKIVLMESNRSRKFFFRKTFEANGIEYELASSKSVLKLDTWFPLELQCKIKPIKPIIVPKYYGAVLHLDLGRIFYQSKNNLIHKSSDYGFEKLQKYDVFYQENTQKNPLFIYVHGGDWVSGDKKDFFGLCKQYADKGYTAVSLNYQLLNLPKVGMKEMIEDVEEAIKNIMNNAKNYNGDSNKTILMADSSGAMLSYMALSKLSKKYQPRRVVFNTLVSNLALYSKEKQIMLSGIEDENNRTKWIDEFSPLSPKNLESYTPKSLIIHNLNNQVIVPKHLEDLEIQSVIHNNNIHSLWTEKKLGDKEQNIALKIYKFIQ